MRHAYVRRMKKRRPWLQRFKGQTFLLRNERFELSLRCARELIIMASNESIFVGSLDRTLRHRHFRRCLSKRLHANSQVQPIFRNPRRNQCERAPHECRSTESLRKQKPTIILLDQSTRYRRASQTRNRNDGKTHTCPHSQLGQI